MAAALLGCLYVPTMRVVYSQVYMLFPLPFSSLWTREGKNSIARIKASAISALLQFLERHLGIRAVYDLALVPYHDPALVRLFSLAKKMHGAGIIYNYQKSSLPPDEPPLHEWSALCHSEINASEQLGASGSSPDSDKEALERMLGEAIERYVWATQTDYFASYAGSVRQLQNKSPVIPPERFSGFSLEARKKNKALTLSDTQSFLWAKAYSWVSQSSVWVPAQLVTGSQSIRKTPREPLIQQCTTAGCATYPTQEGALLRGALELIERDAYMIMWLNQLTLPRINTTELVRAKRTLNLLIERCVRYRLKVHVVRLVTDAPVHVTCVVLEDISISPRPQYSFGLSARFSLVEAVEKALVEAMRMRRAARGMYTEDSSLSNPQKTESVGHADRLTYWMHGNCSAELSFIKDGPIENLRPGDLIVEMESETEMFDRIVKWCKSTDYECLSVALTKSTANVTPWHIERVMIPELQPLHLDDAFPHTGGARIRNIPKQFGYHARKEPYTQRPHPFA